MKKILILLPIGLLLFMHFTLAQYDQTIRVSTAREFYDAIKSNTHIIIETKEMDITGQRLTRLQFKDNPYVKTTPEYVGFLIEKVHNLKISGMGQVKLYTTDEDDRVITFMNCSNIKLENLNIYHRTPAEISCYGEVIGIDNVNQFTVRNCELNGSGTIAMDAYESTNILLSDCKIYNNTNNFFYARTSTNIKIKDCEIYENALNSNGFIMVASDITLEDCLFRDNAISGEFINAFCDNESFITFRNCTFRNNAETARRKMIPKIKEKNSTTFTKNDFSEQCNNADQTADIATIAKDASNDDVATAATSAAGSSLQAWMDAYHSEMINTLKRAGVPVSDINNYYSQIYDFTNQSSKLRFINIDLDDAEIVSKIEKIGILYQLEYEKKTEDLNGINTIFHFPLFSYWGKTNISHADIKKEYLNSWNRLYTSYNIINSVTQKSSNFFDIDLDYLYITKKSKKLQSVHSVIRIQFKDDKIISINPVKS